MVERKDNMKKFIAKKEYRHSQFINEWQEGKPIIIEARDINSARRKAEKMWTVYTHYTIIKEV